jgi:hypothetical protein
MYRQSILTPKHRLACVVVGVGIAHAVTARSHSALIADILMVAVAIGVLIVMHRQPLIRSVIQSSDSQADLILSRFPGPVTLYPSRKKWLRALLASGLCTVGAYLLASLGPWAGVVLGLFASVSIIAAMMLLAGAGALTLDGDGFQATYLFRRRRSRWEDVTRFESVVVAPSSKKMVVYDDINVTNRKMMAKLTVAIASHNAGLPDAYGLTADDLASLMMLWRDRAVAAQK